MKNNNKVSKVLVVSPSRKTLGGITAVVNLYEQSPMWKKYHCRWIGTYRNGRNIIKLLYAMKAIFQYIYLLPFYNIVHIHFSLKGSALRKLPFFIIAKLCNKKTIIHLHCGSQINEIWSSIYQYMFVHCDCGIVLAENIKTTIEQHIGKSDKIHVIYNPCPKIPNLTNYNKQNIILFSGRITKGKGYMDLIRAFSMISQNHPSWKIVLAGYGEIKQARLLAQELGISKQVLLPGWVDGEMKHKTFSEAELLCLPSYAEGFPMAVLDACAYGLPIITTPVGGIPDVAIDNVNMLLFDPPGNIELLSQCLDRLISDKNLRDKLAKEAQNLAATKFNVNTIVNQIGDIYEKLK